MEYYVLIPFLPLAAFLINILFGRKVLKTASHWVSTLAVFGSMIIAYMSVANVIRGNMVDADLYTWIISGTTFKVSVGFLIDQLTAVMLVVVTTVSFLVHVYSIGYMRGESGYYRFFAFLSLFTFSMLMLIMANNLLQLYFGWEAVGLCSYFLIGFYYEKKSAADAGKKAFVVNRFGDFGFGLGVIWIFIALGSLHYADVFANVSSLDQTITILGAEFNLVTVIAILLFCGAVGKSAQVPLHVWLPDAMEGPTPVSALIHAATMVTAGVFMVARLNPIFSLSPAAMNVVAVTGGITALFAATIALVQNDIKRVVAYSTVSQLGYMMMACGVGAFGAGIFHLYTHAFFKALLFLAAGSVLHAMGGELDMKKMGGLKKYMPVTYVTMLIASFSIAGFPPLAGFFSKDEILWLAFNGGTVGKFVWILGALAAVLTAFYSFRLIYLTFHGEFRGTEEQRHHLHESPKVMTIPLIILCVGAVASGWIGIPALLGGEHSNWFAHFVEPVLGHPEVHASHSIEWMVMLFSIAIAVTGFIIARVFYIKKTEIPVRLAEKYPFIHKVLWNKYYVDELYDLIVVRAAKGIAKHFMVDFTDSKIIEGIVNGVPRLIGWFSQQVRKVQSGIVHRYAAVMAAGLFLVFAIMFIKLWG
jgi:NADH-quinone oxidoreductase subunit L